MQNVCPPIIPDSKYFKHIPRPQVVFGTQYPETVVFYGFNAHAEMTGSEEKSFMADWGRMICAAALLEWHEYMYENVAFGAQTLQRCAKANIAVGQWILWLKGENWREANMEGIMEGFGTEEAGRNS